MDWNKGEPFKKLEEELAAAQRFGKGEKSPRDISG